MAIEYDVVPTPAGISITTESNLPDTSELLVTLRSAESSYTGQDRASTVGGVAEFGPFTDKGAQLSGAYELSITLPIARNQPEAVRACIGEAGEALAGPLVSVEEITGDKTARVEGNVTVD